MVRRYDYRYTNPFNLDDMDREKDSIHSVPFWVGFLVILALCGIFGIVVLLNGILPTALIITDEADYPHAFIAERAVKDLEYLTSLGPKIAGSYENEYLVVEFLTTKINKIISEVGAKQYLELDIQKVSGSYYLNDAGGYINVYDKIQSVVVKLHGYQNDSGHSILVNAHYDSVPTSPGASDDGINVVAMLELIRKLSQANIRQRHNVIFLFNGAEETPLQASHGFITHHKWAKESKILINLEASGSGGKIILFQTGPDNPWLVKYYSKLPHPHGVAMGEEIFQAGIIPSDTDFRVFRDYGNTVGVDMAFFGNGYRYHTKYDDFANIPTGSYQHVGDNTLALIKYLANAQEVLEKENSTGKTVYYDIFGWFMIYYSQNDAIIINVVVSVFSIGIFLFSLFFEFRAGFNKATFTFIFFTLGAILMSWLLAIGFVFAIAVVLDLMGKTMSWYGTPWFIFGLYVIPIVGLSGSLLFLTNQRFTYFQNLSLGVRSQVQAHLMRILWTLILIGGTALGIRSVYPIMILVLFNTLGFVIIHLFRLHYTIRTWQIMYLASHFIPALLQLYQMLLTLMTFIPVTGRMGAQTNPEYIIAVLALFWILQVISPFSILTNLFKRAIWYFLGLVVIFLVFLVVLFTPLGFPYSGNPDSPKPQRHWILHTGREFYNESGLIRADSGFLMANMDRNSPEAVKSHVKEISSAQLVDADCEEYALCGLPLVHGKTLNNLKYSTWIPSTPPDYPQNETLKLTVVSKERLAPLQIKYNVEVSGPDKLMLYFNPKPNTKLISTSLTDAVKPLKLKFKERPVYVVLYQLGKGDGSPLSFNFVMEVPDVHVGPTLDFAVSGRYVHEGRIQKRSAYLEFLRQFPDWAHVISWLGAYQSHEL